ncbi:MAG: SusC/RagA family TonB-linked outer membrane protein, partial [Chitinophagia bacterium]|nr:SusC/RagA family TonB-linked outer membrane protein [Chitinophagia bacterium]
MLFCATLFAQTIQVRGRVSDDKGAVSDATVQERGTSNSVKADLNGMFTISVKANAVLVVTAVGHQPLEVAATAQFMNVGLTVQGGELSEVVVTALGIKRRPKEMGYANTTVKADQITVGQSPRLGQALAGKVAGLTVYNTSNAVNSSPRIVLRGNRSITGDNTALIVLDGVTVPSNTLNYLNPNDIE